MEHDIGCYWAFLQSLLATVCSPGCWQVLGAAADIIGVAYATVRPEVQSSALPVKVSKARVTGHNGHLLQLQHLQYFHLVTLTGNMDGEYHFVVDAAQSVWLFQHGLSVDI